MSTDAWTTPTRWSARPHAEASRARGYCRLANISLAAVHAQRVCGLGRVAVVDWDVHHGNGTEDAFYADPSVLRISLHEEERYPAGRGLVDHGEGDGEGCNLNVPLPDGSGHGAYILAMERVVIPALRRFDPDLILVASGFDASAFDPLGRQMLHSESYRRMTEMLLEIAATCCDGRLMLVHEGGYSAAYVPFCGVGLVETLIGTRRVADPFREYLVDRPGQAVQPHQRAAVDRAAGLADRVPAVR